MATLSPSPAREHSFLARRHLPPAIAIPSSSRTSTTPATHSSADGAAAPVIDLTGPSPPARANSHLLAPPTARSSTADEQDNRRSSKRRRVAGPAGSTRSATTPATAADILVIDSDDEDEGSDDLEYRDFELDDDDLVIVGQGLGASASASASTSNQGPSAAAGRRRITLPSNGTRGFTVEPPSYSQSTASRATNVMSRLMNRLHSLPSSTSSTSHPRVNSASSASAASTVAARAAQPYDNAWRSDSYDDLYDDVFRPDEYEDYAAVLSLIAHTSSSYIPSGFQGLWGGSAKVNKSAKRYGVRMSHPRKVEEGFMRDLVNPDDLDAPGGVGTKAAKKGKKKVQTLTPAEKGEVVPGCASCLEPLRLAQSGLGRPWGLKCGHVICGRCVDEARGRCRDIKDSERKARWTLNIDGRGIDGSKGKGKGKQVVSDSEAVDEPKESSGSTPSSSPSGSSGKGKGKSTAYETGIDDSWTCCPVDGCDGAGTDLLAKEGDYDGPFELFV